jgi:hypothetical protein
MNHSIKHLLYFSILCLISSPIFSQSDSSKVKKIDSEITGPQNTGQLKVDFSKTKINPNTPFDLNIDKKLNTEAIHNNLNKANPNKTQNFLMENLPEDQDIIGKRYWNNKDVTHKKLESNFSLGTVKSNTKTVKIECRDYSYIDGDRIRIYVNEQVVSDNIALRGNYYVYYLTLEKGYNRIDFQAINQGLSGPNTAELNLYDANGTLISSKEWNLETGQTATLGVINY